MQTAGWERRKTKPAGCAQQRDADKENANKDLCFFDGKVMGRRKNRLDPFEIAIIL